MIQNTDIARRLGYLNIPDEDIVDAYDLKGCLLYTSRCV